MLTVANLLSHDLNDLAQEIRSSLQSALNREIGLMREPTVDDFRKGRVGIALICGLAYSLLHDAAPGRFVPVAAPVVDDDRVGHAPVYFSEVVVPVSSRARGLRDLAGARFAYNEAISFSGYRALEHELVALGLGWDFFGGRIRTGSHDESIERLVTGEADAAAIDSHVLLLKRRRNPSLAAKVRSVTALGPYPAPPVAVNRDACDLSVARLRSLLEELSPEVVRAAAISGWKDVDDAYYDAIRTAVGDIPVGSG